MAKETWRERHWEAHRQIQSRKKYTERGGRTEGEREVWGPGMGGG